MLGERERALYARQILLPEIGLAGQGRLCEASVALAPQADEDAARWAETYLTRAGLRVADRAAAPAPAVAMATEPEVDAIAGDDDPPLRHAAAALAGCLAAVETIKSVLEVGQPAAPQVGVTLTGHNRGKESR